MAIRAIVVDRETQSREALRWLIERFIDDVEVVAGVGSIDEAIDAVRKYRPDLVFLDIAFPRGDGFELLERLPDDGFRIIFVSDDGEYAIRALRLSGVDYVLKPVDPENLRAVIGKVRHG